VLLVVVFAGGFIFFGVGSGSNSAGSLGDLFNNLFNGGSSGPSISKAQKEIQKNPKSAVGWKDLATAYQARGNIDQALSAWQTYTSLRPKDVSGLTELAALETQQLSNLQQQAALAQEVQQNAYGAGAPGDLSNTSIGRAAGSDPFATAVQSQGNGSTTQVYSQLQTTQASTVSTYQKLAKLQPTNAEVQYTLGQLAQSAGQTTVAVAAYKKAAKLLPANAAQIDKIIQQLQPKKK
jgi:cytochrome c-type biogenesis protein CcmH/NrfG